MERRLENGTTVIDKETGRILTIVNAIEIDDKDGGGYIYQFGGTSIHWGLRREDFTVKEEISPLIAIEELLKEKSKLEDYLVEIKERMNEFDERIMKLKDRNNLL